MPHIRELLANCPATESGSDRGLNIALLEPQPAYDDNGTYVSTPKQPFDRYLIRLDTYNP